MYGLQRGKVMCKDCDEALKQSANQLHDGLAFCVKCGRAYIWDGCEGWTLTGSDPDRDVWLEEWPIGYLPDYQGLS